MIKCGRFRELEFLGMKDLRTESSNLIPEDNYEITVNMANIKKI